MKTLTTIALAIICALSAMAQEKSTDYIYSPDGFKVITVSCPMYTPERGGSSTCTGLYSADGKVLVQAIYDTFGSRSSYFYVKAGTEVIASRAFQAFEGGMVYFPSTVTSIAPDAFTSITTKSSIVLGLYDKATEIPSRAPAVASDNAEAKEVARYTLEGRKIASPQPGINIVEMSDNTAKKELVR